MPLTEGFLPTLGEFIMDYTMNGRDTPTQGNRHRLHAPHNVYPCRGDDQWIAIDVGTDEAFTALCQVLDAGQVAADARFRTAPARLDNVDALDAALGALTRGHDKEELFHALQAVGVCAAPVRTAVEVLADPQLNAAGFLPSCRQVMHSRCIAIRGCFSAWRARRTPCAPARRD